MCVIIALYVTALSHRLQRSMQLTLRIVANYYCIPIGILKIKCNIVSLILYPLFAIPFRSFFLQKMIILSSFALDYLLRLFPTILYGNLLGFSLVERDQHTSLERGA